MRRTNARLVLPLAFTLATLALTLGYTPLARIHAASTPGSMTISPGSGPVGTSVDVAIIPPVGATTPATYTLESTTTAPTSGGCSSAQPIPGIAPVVVGAQGGGTTFAWPASLNKGPYWLCAKPASGSDIYTSQPYTVTAPNEPTATATAVPRTTATAVVANVPASGALVGSTFTLTITHWVSPLGTPPEAVNLSASDPSLIGLNGEIFHVPFTTAPGPNKGDYVLTAVVPATLLPLTYWAIVSDQRGFVYSSPFKVIVPTTPTPNPASSPAPSETSSFPIVLVPIIAALVCVTIIMLTAALLRRRARSYR